MKFNLKNVLALGILAIGLTTKAEVIQVVAPNATAVFTVSTNRASVYQVEVTSTVGGFINLYDADSITAPIYGTNYTNASFTTRITYPTNYVYSFIGYNGFTNWYTNVGIWTITVTNAANTNAMNPLVSIAVAPNTYIVQNVDALFIRGITGYSSSSNAVIVVNYRPAR